VDEYLCLTLLANPGEPETAFKARLSELWSAVCRGQPDTFEKVYAETVAFEPHEGRVSRKYLIEAVAAEEIASLLRTAGMEYLPIDPDDLYSKYEAAPPEWFWIEH
jgi:hypothetical protein